jgi:chemotaxis signal transduction protein
MKLLMVSVGEGRYAVPADAVAQIVDPAVEPDFHLEDAAAVYRGERLPVLDLHAAAGERRGAAPVYLLLAGAHRRVIVAVDGAEAIRDVPAGEIAPLPAFIFARPRRAFRGVFSDGRTPRLLLDEDAIL